MLKRYEFGFCEALIRIEGLRQDALVWAGREHAPPKKVDAHRIDALLSTLEEMRAECIQMDLTHTPDTILHIESKVDLKGQNYTHGDMLNHLESLTSSFTTELRRKFVFRIAYERMKYFENVDLLGPQAAAAFPSCVTKFKDAGNCLALEQNDASAFHSMKVPERGLEVLATKFGVDFSHTNWHNVIQQTEKEIRNMGPSFGSDWKDQQNFCAEAATHFMFLKDAWRNHIMHARDVPYDEGKALSIFSHVREFMLALTEGGLKE